MLWFFVITYPSKKYLEYQTRCPCVWNTYSTLTGGVFWNLEPELSISRWALLISVCLFRVGGFFFGSKLNHGVWSICNAWPFKSRLAFLWPVVCFVWASIKLPADGSFYRRLIFYQTLFLRWNNFRIDFVFLRQVPEEILRLITILACHVAPPNSLPNQPCFLCSLLCMRSASYVTRQVFVIF